MGIDKYNTKSRWSNVTDKCDQLTSNRKGANFNGVACDVLNTAVAWTSLWLPHRWRNWNTKGRDRGEKGNGGMCKMIGCTTSLTKMKW